MTTAQEILDSNDPENLINIVYEQGRRIEELEKKFLDLQSLDEISSDLGDMVNGRFIAPAESATDYQPADAGFTGAFVSGTGEQFTEGNIRIGGVNAGKLQVGITEDGNLIAGNSSFKVTADGASINEIGDAFDFLGKARITCDQLGVGKYALKIENYQKPTSSSEVNGDFETGDFTGWTLGGVSTPVISPDFQYQGAYSARLGNGLSSMSSMYQEIAATSADSFYLEFRKMTFTPSGQTGSVKIEYMTAGGASLYSKTVYLKSNIANSWSIQTVGINPETAGAVAKVRVTFSVTGGYTWIDNVKIYKSATVRYTSIVLDADATEGLIELSRDVLVKNNLTVNGNLSISGNVTGITASQVGAVPGSSFDSGAIADDGFASFDLPSTKGIIIITNLAGVAVAEHLIAYFNTITPRLNAWDTGASTAVTTGALTGTTGTDGNFTASVHTNGKLYLENRRGGNRAYGIAVLSL